MGKADEGSKELSAYATPDAQLERERAVAARRARDDKLVLREAEAMRLKEQEAVMRAAAAGAAAAAEAALEARDPVYARFAAVRRGDAPPPAGECRHLAQAQASEPSCVPR